MRYVCVLCLFSLASQHALAGEFGGYLTLTSDYVKRGVTQSDGNPALQLGGEFSFDNGFYLGAWGSSVDIGNGSTFQRDLEVSYFGGFVLEASDSWRVSIGAVAYDYAVQSDNFDYRYEEYTIGGNFDDSLWIEYSYSPDAYGSGRSSTNVELFGEWPLNDVWAVSGGVGHFDTDTSPQSSYQYWQLGIAGEFRWADIDFRVHGAERWIPIISSADRSQSRIALTLQIPF